jgi:hypothetical protein
MFVDYSVPLDGILAAGRNIEQSAHRIAAANLPLEGDAEDSLTLTGFAAELIAVNRNKIAVKADLQIIETRQDLERESLDLFA